MKCLVCNTETTNPKFCSRSCSATYNNTGRRRHGNPKANCQQYGAECSTSGSKFCSVECRAASTTKSKDHKRKMNALRQHRYRAKKYRVLAEDADPQRIKEIYLNCPNGYEVDHIHPLSLGGKHHEDNLQYLPWRVNRSKSNRYIG